MYVQLLTYTYKQNHPSKLNFTRAEMKLMKINHMNIRMMKKRSTSVALFYGLLFMVHAYFYHFHHFTYVIRESVIMIIFHFFFRSRVFHIKYVFPFPYVYSFILFVLFWPLCCLISSSSDHLLYFDCSPYTIHKYFSQLFSF